MIYEVIRNWIGYFGEYDYIIEIGSLCIIIAVIILIIRVVKWVIN